MKLTIFTILALCIIAVCKSAEEEYDYEEEAAAPVTPAPAKPAGGRLGGLLSSRGRVNVPNVGKKKAPAQSTTAKPIEPAPEEGEVEGEDAFDENEEELTTTTESAKKLRNNGGVRPFRSNEDLLAALKRRRAQTGPSVHVMTGNSQSRETAATEHTTAKTKASTNNRNKASAGNEARTSGRGRFGGRGKTVQEEVEETQREEIQVKPKANSYRRRS